MLTNKIFRLCPSLIYRVVESGISMEWCIYVFYESGISMISTNFYVLFGVSVTACDKFLYFAFSSCCRRKKPSICILVPARVPLTITMRWGLRWKKKTFIFLNGLQVNLTFANDSFPIAGFLFQAGYEGYGDYEPHTGDPQYDLEYDRQYYQMPEVVSTIISLPSPYIVLIPVIPIILMYDSLYENNYLLFIIRMIGFDVWLVTTNG